MSFGRNLDTYSYNNCGKFMNSLFPNLFMNNYVVHPISRNNQLLRIKNTSPPSCGIINYFIH